MTSRLPHDAPVLVVDDSPAIRARMESYLQQLGFKRVRTAASVGEALEAFDAEPADIVFLDMVIDEERGLDFAAQALEKKPFTHIVLMTALPSSSEQVTASIAEGARDFLSKPVTRSSLEAVLERAMVELGGEEEEEPPAAARVEDRSYV